MVATDQDGRTSNQVATSVTVTPVPTSSTTTLTTSTTYASYGQTVTLTANVAGSPGQAPTSTVNFLLSGNGYSNYSLGSVRLGAGSISAATNYAGYPTLLSTASTAGLTSGQQVTISGVGTVANGTYYIYVFSATVFGLYNNSTFTMPVIGNGTYTSGGTWTANNVSVATLNVNTTAIPINANTYYPYYTITAQYGGDSTYASSSGTNYLVVSASPTTTTIAPASGTSSPGLYGVSSRFIATVLSTGAGTPGAPLGTVTFYVNSVAQQTVALSTLSSSISSISSGTGNLFQINTSNTAGLANGDRVTLSGTTVTNGTFSISNLTATSFTLVGQNYASGGTNGTWTLANGSAATFTSNSLSVGTDSILAIYNNAQSGTISAASNAGPIVITTNSTAGLANGEAVYVYSVGGDTAANGFWTIGNVTGGPGGGTFTLVGSSGNGAYTSGGAWLLEPDYSSSYSTTPDSFVVNPASTTISSFQATVNGVVGATSSTFGQAITLQATVSPVAPATATPTGSVTFMNGSTVLATVNLVNGVATWTTTSTTYLNAGTYSNTITATYNPSTGPQDFGSSTGTLSNFTVSSASTTVTALVSSNTSYTYGAYPYLTFTATVTPTSPASMVPAAFGGTVEFYLNGVASGIAAVNATTGVATYTDVGTQLPVGNYTVTAQYQGVSGGITAAANYTGYPVLISTASTTGLTSGEQVTISGVGNIANGSYYIYVFNANIFGLYSNASLTSPVSASGTFTGGTWTATDYHASPVSSSSINQHIGSASTTTLTTSTTYASYGQTVTLTANVAGSPGQAPTSTVTFLLSGNGYSNYSLGSVSLGAGSITGATNYAGYPTLLSTASTAGLTSGQQVTISGVGTVANGTYYIYVFNSTMFGLYTNSSFTSPVVGNGTFTSGGTWTATDVAVATLNVNTTAIPINANTASYPYYTITAQYGGDSFHGSSSGTNYLVVTPSPTTTTITTANGTSSPASYGATSSFIATVLSTGAGTPGDPLGSVTFYVNGIAQQTVYLSALSNSISGTSHTGASSPVVVTTRSTAGLANGDQVTISNASDTKANGTWTISNLTATSFTLSGSSTSTTGGSGGTWTLANGSAATFISNTLPVGTNSILAVYNTPSAAASAAPAMPAPLSSPPAAPSTWPAAKPSTFMAWAATPPPTASGLSTSSTAPSSPCSAPPATALTPAAAPGCSNPTTPPVTRSVP